MPRLNGKRFVSMLLVFVMLFAMIPVGTFAEEGEKEQVTVAEEIPAPQPTEVPTPRPTEAPTPQPTPTEAPSEAPTEAPTEAPVEQPTEIPAEKPTEVPAETPTEAPVEQPTEVPAEKPTEIPVETPTEAPEGEVGAEPTTVPAELTAQMTADSNYAFVGQDDKVAVTVAIAGGTAPYSVQLKVDGEKVQETQAEQSGKVALKFVPTKHGDYELEAVVADAAGAVVSAGKAVVMVAEEDRETKEEWIKDFDDLELTGDWREDIVTIADSQVGYKESKIEFVLDDDNEKQGYTRYGDWYGRTYSEWCTMFVSFCANYAGIPGKYLSRNNICAELKEDLIDAGAYEDDEDEYTPRKGDLIFFHWVEEDEKENNRPEHIGIVEFVKNGRVHTIEGNSGRAVKRNDYVLDDRSIVGYVNMTKLMERSGLFETPEVDESLAGMIPRTNTDCVNVRASSTTASDVVTQINKAGSELTVLGATTAAGGRLRELAGGREYQAVHSLL